MAFCQSEHLHSHLTASEGPNDNKLCSTTCGWMSPQPIGCCGRLLQQHLPPSLRSSLSHCGVLPIQRSSQHHTLSQHATVFQRHSPPSRDLPIDVVACRHFLWHCHGMKPMPNWMSPHMCHPKADIKHRRPSLDGCILGPRAGCCPSLDRCVPGLTTSRHPSLEPAT